MTDLQANELRAVSRGISARLFNDKVRERYEGNQELLNCCLIQPFDTIPEMTFKQNTFFFTLNNFTPNIIEKIRLRNRANGAISKGLIWAMVHLKFKETYIKDSETKESKPVGQRTIKVSNVDPEVIELKKIRELLRGKELLFGSNWVTYNFTNGKEIRLEHVSTREDGIKLIEVLLQLTLKEFQQPGNVSKNCFTVIPPELNTPKIDMFGKVGYVYKITFHQMEGKREKKFRSIMIPNKAREK